MAGRSYPLAVAVINFCSVLGDQLRLKQFAPTAASSSSSSSSVDPESCPLFRVFCELDDEFQFEEVLVCYVRLFDRLWVETAAGYMDFPHILSEVCAYCTLQNNCIFVKLLRLANTFASMHLCFVH
jgi:hypothetical protein